MNDNSVTFYERKLTLWSSCPSSSLGGPILINTGSSRYRYDRIGSSWYCSGSSSGGRVMPLEIGSELGENADEEGARFSSCLCEGVRRHRRK